MALVCRATWTVAEGKEETVREALTGLCPASREEDGIQVYEAYVNPDEPRVFRLFEIYDDQEAFDFHAKTPHFKKYVLNDVIPVLENRVREFYQTVDA